MKITYQWLKELLDLPESVQEITNTLTSLGLEVESVSHRSIPDTVLIGSVLEVAKHPNAEKLTICTVNYGKPEPLTIVCGAPNVRKNMKVAIAMVGTTLGPGITIQKLSIRGVESTGMLCSEKELGISDNHQGIICLPDSFSVGDRLNQYYHNDSILDIAPTPNRGDCLSVIGIARELAAKFGRKLKPYIQTPQESSSSQPIHQFLSIQVEDKVRCPRYLGRLVRGVTIKESPDWLKQRLCSVGLRPINNVVDCTNYILLLFGQPLHAFDYEKIAGKKILVKTVQDKQPFTTLDGINRSITPEDLLICDTERGIAIAGVMGGLDSEIRETTQDVFIEAAYFDPVSIRKTRKRLDISTDASYRFERGVDPADGLMAALETATSLIHTLAGGTVCKGILQECGIELTPKTIILDITQVHKILGIKISKETILTILANLNIGCINQTEHTLTVESPLYRHDICSEIDLIEEIGRVYGYDSIEARNTALIPLLHKPRHQETISGLISSILASRGFHETKTYSMIAKKKCELFTKHIIPVQLRNPLNPDLACMRTTLLHSLLEVTSYNLNRKNMHNRLFEIGKRYWSTGSDSLPIEQWCLAILMEGDANIQSWNMQKQELTFFHVKNILECILSALHISNYSYKPCSPSSLLMLGKESVELIHTQINGICGKIEDRILKDYDIATPVMYAEIDITALFSFGIVLPSFKEIPRLPAIERDFAFVIQESIASESIIKAMKEVSGLVVKAEVFDVYRGDKIAAGHKSIAIAAHFRSDDKTLTDEEADRISNKIIQKLKTEFNAVLRT